MRAIVVTKPGGWESLELKTIAQALPKDHEVTVQNHAIGVNYIDIYQRNGLYKVAFPFILGREGAGIVTHVGSKVNNLQVGDRVVYLTNQGGAYADSINAASKWVCKLPTEISFEVAASSFLKGLTAHMLLKEVFKLNSKQTVFIHAAAGGVGTILGQWAKSFGATIIGAVGSKAKEAYLKHVGYDLLLNYNVDDILESTLAFTDNKGVDVVYDGVGASTFFKSAAMLKRMGLLVSYGQASGTVPDFSLNLLASKSLFLTRPAVFHYLDSPTYFAQASKAVFESIINKRFMPSTTQIYPLYTANTAHRDLESRSTMGAIILKP